MIAGFAFVQALLLAAAAPAATGAERDRARFEACVAKIDRDAEEAYREASVWAEEEHVFLGRQCAAMALAAMGKSREAAEKLESLAYAEDGGDEAMRVATLAQAGNAWLLAGEGARAAAVLDRALSRRKEDPDLLIDRARAHAMQANWAKAEDDLSRALDKRPADALALLLRAQARLEQNAFDLALKDAEAAVARDPRNIDALLVRGQAREAKRRGAK